MPHSKKLAKLSLLRRLFHVGISTLSAPVYHVWVVIEAISDERMRMWCHERSHVTVSEEWQRYWTSVEAADDECLKGRVDP